MGIIGLSTFIKQIYQKTKEESSVFKLEKLGDLKLVIDANCISYILFESSKSGHYGGNYDEIYKKLHDFLIKLKPFIEILIFDGSKEDLNKAESRLIQRICRIANLDENSYMKLNDKMLQLENLKSYPPLFTRAIFYEVLNDLEIPYLMSNQMADHSIACYANGYFTKSSYFTVLSRDSCFNVYDLEKGYITWEHANHLISNPSINENTCLPVFYLKNLLSYLSISRPTWLYFCISCGIYDTEISKNTTYFKTKNINPHNYEKIISYLRDNEKTNLSTNFSEIRRFYKPEQLKAIDNLLDLFEFKVKDTSFLADNPNDYDRFVLNILDMDCSLVCCLVEDCNEANSFHIAQATGILEMAYYLICKNEQETKSNNILEIFRVKNPPYKGNFKTVLYQESISIKKQKTNFIYDYLEKSSGQENASNNYLTLLLVSLSVWHKWLGQNRYTNSIKNSPDDLVDSILINLIILNMETHEEENLDSPAAETVFQKHSIDYQTRKNLTESYDEMKKLVTKMNTYYADHLRLVHRLNELQTFYYTIGLLNKLAKFKFTQLSPSKFINGQFLINYLTSQDLREKIDALIQSNKRLIDLKNYLKMELTKTINNLYDNSCLNSLNSNFKDMKI